ncbi:MAG: hypothetical protein KIT17_09425 [Rubrivivax sp.]|nr:hypothetical protein [Rubrivivax sp.]
MKLWNVRVHRDGRSVTVGQVSERNETLARCAALARFGVSDEELEAGEVRAPGNLITPDEEFDVSPAA